MCHLSSLLLLLESLLCSPPCKLQLIEGQSTIYPPMTLRQALLSDGHLLSFPLPYFNILVEARLWKNKLALKPLLVEPT